jgi:hypothetical protein
MERGAPRADEPDGVVVQLDMDRQEHAQLLGQAEQQGALLVGLVLDGQRQWIREDGRGLLEGHPMLLGVGGDLRGSQVRSTAIVYYS